MYLLGIFYLIIVVYGEIPIESWEPTNITLGFGIIDKQNYTISTETTDETETQLTLNIGFDVANVDFDYIAGNIIQFKKGFESIQPLCFENDFICRIYNFSPRDGTGYLTLINIRIISRNSNDDYLVNASKYIDHMGISYEIQLSQLLNEKIIVYKTSAYFIENDNRENEFASILERYFWRIFISIWIIVILLAALFFYIYKRYCKKKIKTNIKKKPKTVETKPQPLLNKPNTINNNNASNKTNINTKNNQNKQNNQNNNNNINKTSIRNNNNNANRRPNTQKPIKKPNIMRQISNEAISSEYVTEYSEDN